MDSIFAALGVAFTSGIGFLFMAAMAAAVVLVWDWRVTLASVVVLHVGASAMAVHLHDTPALLAASQTVAVVFATGLLAWAGALRRAGIGARRAGTILLRVMALIFATTAWWFVDPGVTLPTFSQIETDLLFWIALCGLLVLCLTENPLLVAAALLLWCVPLQAVATVLLPGSGLPVLIGIAELVTALACSYLLLTEPSTAAQTARRPMRMVPSRPAARIRHPLAPAPSRALAQPIQENTTAVEKVPTPTPEGTT